MLPGFPHAQPAIASLALSPLAVLPFVGALYAGMALNKLYQGKR